MHNYLTYLFKVTNIIIFETSNTVKKHLEQKSQGEQKILGPTCMNSNYLIILILRFITAVV